MSEVWFEIDQEPADKPNPNVYLVKQDSGLFRFVDDDPHFNQIYDLWARMARYQILAEQLDWDSFPTMTKQVLVSVAAPWPFTLHPDRSEAQDKARALEFPSTPTQEQIVGLIEGLSTGEIAADFVDWDGMDHTLRSVIWIGSRHEIHRLRRIDQRRRRGGPQRKAMTLLKTLLTPTQRQWLKRRRYFLLRAKSGHVYRLMPNFGNTSRVTLHGSRWFDHTQFCLHDQPRELPPADVTIAHLLLLRTDEARFLELANATDARMMFWNGDWLRRLNRRRRKTDAVVAGALAKVREHWTAGVTAVDEDGHVV